MAWISAAIAIIPLLFASFWTWKRVRKTPAFS
jgi:FtsZ-interacting cell division protein ZipA